MTTHTITRAVALVASRLTAFVAGCIFIACAGAILFEDVALQGAPITLSHLLTAGVLSGTLLVGHLLIDAKRGRHWLAALGFVVLFITGTGLIVYLSTGKQAEHTFQSQAEADLAAEERARIKPLLVRAEKMLEEQRAIVAREAVKVRCGDVCKGAQVSAGVYEAAVTGYKADIARLGTPKPVAPDAESFANVASVLFGADKAKVKAGAILVVPFVRTILFELGGLWCLGFAFRPLPRTATEETKAEKAATQATAAERAPLSPSEQSDFCTDDIDEARKLGIGGDPRTGSPGNWGNSVSGGGRKPPKGGNGGGPRVYSRAEALLDLTRRLASGETVAAQDDLAEAWHVDKSTVAKWLKRWRADGLVPAAQRIGRCHRLVAAE
ncbi:MAG: helix-turn-helix domain-containing protein [Hyphomicrobium sp.]|uniref:helix-turn-helix domain-containing protein n=1 Tax=Hyphomicrobium sp. TaxID=82 RepID=UPI003D0F772B